MIADELKNLDRYPEFAKYAKAVKGFVAGLTPDTPDGRYDLMGDELFVNLQHYVTREKTGAGMEAHKIYADLQYIVSGREYIYYNPVEELTVAEDRTPEIDILLYEPGPDKGGSLLEPGMFGYYAPQDAHMPGIAPDGPAPACKAVFKIKVG